MGIDAPNYNENAKVLSLADKEGGSRDRRLLRGEALARACRRLVALSLCYAVCCPRLSDGRQLLGPHGTTRPVVCADCMPPLACLT